MPEGQLVNRVANSPIQTIDPASFMPDAAYVVFDIKDYLFQGLILKEIDFRKALKELETEQFAGKVVLVICSNDAIIPQWAYALISVTLSDSAEDVFVGNQAEYIKSAYRSNVEKIDIEQYTNVPIILKGCGDQKLPEEAYSLLAKMLKPVAKSIMYGEACSAVPIYKQPKK